MPARWNMRATASPTRRRSSVPTSTGIAELVQALRLLENRVVLLAPRLVDQVLPVVADHRLVRRDHRDLELVDLVELRLFRLGRAGHAGELLVHAEVVLDRDRRHASASRPSPARLPWPRPPGAVPRDQRRPGIVRPVNSSTISTCAVLHDVVHVLLVQRVRAQQLVHDVQPLALRRVLDARARRARVELLLGATASGRDRCGAPPREMSGSRNAS